MLDIFYDHRSSCFCLTEIKTVSLMFNRWSMIIVLYFVFYRDKLRVFNVKQISLFISGIFLKHQVNWNTVYGAMRDLPWRNIWSSDNPVEVLNEHLSLLVGRYVPTKIIRVRNKDKPWFDDLCGRAFDLKQEAHLRWTRDRSRVNWEEFVCRQVRANEVYSEAKHQFGVRNIDVPLNVQSPHKWWSTLKSTVFGSSSSLPPLVGPSGGLVC